MKIEKLMQQLDEILKKMEQGVTVEEGMLLFEQGLEIARQCYDSLDKTKGQLDVLTASLNTLS